MDFSFTEDEALLTTTLRRWSERQLRAWAAEADRAAVPPAALWQAAGELGLMVDAIPEESGGLLEGSYSHLQRALRGIELGRGCAGLAALCETNVEPALAVARWGKDPARKSFYGAVPYGSFVAVTIQDFQDRLSITNSGDGLRVNGVTGPVPCLAMASHALIAARAGDEPVLFLLAVEKRFEAMTPSGWRAALWGKLNLDKAEVPAGFVLARGADARAAISEVRAWLNVSLAARAVGVATAAIEHAAAYGEERVQFGQPIGRFESLARMRDENQTAIAAARLLVLEAAWRVDRGAEGAADVASRARDLAAQVVTRATIDAVQMYGGYGFVNDFPVEKLMRDARAFEVLGGNEALARLTERV